MILTPVWGALVIFTVCPLLGGLPLIQWTTRALTGQRLNQLGTGNISVSAAFYHGGRWAGILAVLSEAGKGIVAVLIARFFFPADPAWEIVALISLVMGRYWFGKAAGTTNVVWGYVVHDPLAAGLVFLIGSISFTVLRERNQAKFGILILFPLITALLHPYEQELILAAIALAALLAWIYTKIPDDLQLKAGSAQANSRSMLQFFQGDGRLDHPALHTLEQPLIPQKFGQKAATLAHLKRLGYPVPMGWVLAPGDDPQLLIDRLSPSPRNPLVVRSSALGEDSETASAAGQYESILNITSRDELLPAISRCFASYQSPSAAQYRRDRGLPEATMTVLIQQQIRGAFSGVAFSRDPIARQGNTVVIEALPGPASQVVSGKVTPATYQVQIEDDWIQASWVLPDDLTLPLEGEGDVPPRLIQQVAYLVRHLEIHFQGTPQDLEWTYDGQKLWLLQSRPVTTLFPLWTRKIAAEVIPGVIRPLTWSINRPLTCGVWGDLFTLVLGDRARGLDFQDTATLHYSRAYFNASLLGTLFRRMGLPPESLEFLTRGASFSKPPLRSTLRNLPGLLRLARREMRLAKDFRREYRQVLAGAIADLARQPASQLSALEILARIDQILALLQGTTYYSILAPLSAALRKGIFQVRDEDLDNGATPEVAALRSLQQLAAQAHPLLRPDPVPPADTVVDPARTAAVFSQLEETVEGRAILQQLTQIIQQYGYLSEVGTDIAIPTWRENPQPVQDLFAQFCINPPPIAPRPSLPKASTVQQRFDLKGQVTEVYSRLLAELRWSFVALEQQWIGSGILTQPGDLFFLEFDEIRLLVERGPASFGVKPEVRIAQRQQVLQRDRQLTSVPFLVYGDDPPAPLVEKTWVASQKLQGIGASPGQVEGRVKILHRLEEASALGRGTILVVPYTDSGWAPVLAQVGGLIAEVGGRLSHGAIVAREYRIPAVMDVHQATQRLMDGQLVRIDGQQGTVEVL